MALNAKERARFKIAEENMRAKYPAAQCLWEISHPKSAPRVAMLAAFIVGNGLLILMVYRDGDGFEFFAAPKTHAIAGSLDAIAAMWGEFTPAA